MTKKLLKISVEKSKVDKLKLKPKKGGMLEFILKNGKTHGHPVDALELVKKYCGRG